MAELTTLARPYAKAAFQFANEHNSLAEWLTMLDFVSVVAQDPTVGQILDDPTLTTAAQGKAFEDICGDQLNQACKNFVGLLARNKRMALLPEIARLFEKLKAEKEQTVDVELTSAFEVTRDQTDKLTAALKEYLDMGVNISSSVDQSLVGGLIVRAGDLVIDGSVRGKLAKLTETMNS